MYGRREEKGGLSPAKSPHLSGCDLLQGILAFGKTRVLHDDHDDGHLLVNQRQGPMLQFTSQNTFRVHVGYLFNFLGKHKVESVSHWAGKGL